ncbi:MAG: hypothetical protein ACPGUH_04455 [Winogradskyella sp.]
MDLKILSFLFMLSALFVGLYQNKYIKKSTEKAFVYYIGYALTNDIIVVSLSSLSIDPYILIDLYEIITFSFFSVWYYIIIKEKRKVIKYLSFLYLIILILSLIAINNLTISNLYALITTLIFVTLHYNSLLNKKEVVNYLSEPKFWFSSGVLIYQVGFLPVMILLIINKGQKLDIDIFTVILNIIFYSCIIKGFLCYKK